MAHEKDKLAAVEKLFQQTDWDLLRQQYEELATCIEDKREFAQDQEEPSFHHHLVESTGKLTGILFFLEAVKDVAVDHFNVPAIIAYGPTYEDTSNS